MKGPPVKRLATIAHPKKTFKFKIVANTKMYMSFYVHLPREFLYSTHYIFYVIHFKICNQLLLEELKVYTFSRVGRRFFEVFVIKTSMIHVFLYTNHVFNGVYSICKIHDYTFLITFSF